MYFRSNLPTSKTNSKYVEQKHDVPVARRVTRSQTRSTNKELLHRVFNNLIKRCEVCVEKQETVKEEDNACGDTPRNDGESTLLEDNNSDKENVIHVENHSPEKIIAQAKTPLCTPERPVDQDVVLPIHYSRRSTMNVDRNSSLRGSPLLESVDNVQNVENIKIHGICYFSTTFDLPPDVSDLIGVAIGMTKLLLTKKFRQFKGLVDMCENGPKEDEKPVTCSDLDGFWDMMYMEVENLDCRFKNLNDLKSNNWVEKVPEEKKSKPRAPTKRPKKVQKAATSSMKAVIAAAREKQMREINTGSALQTAEIYMPVKTDSVRTPTSRQTLLRQAISGQRESRGVSRRSSPIIMKVSQLAKRVSNKKAFFTLKISDASNDLEVQPSVSSTPRKSILKTVTTKIQEDKMTTETDVAVDSGPSRRSTRKVRFEGRSMSKQQNDRPSFLNTTDAASPVISFNSDLISFDSPITEPLRVRRRSSRLSQL
ncbi:hypothetical protein C0J52_10282 [Blattella germanica]|nr:hypothetical protein C0J52_10282 [Blattella germanica]